MKISNRHRRTYSLAVFCALASVFLILYGCGDDDDGGPVAVPNSISGQVTWSGSGLSGVRMKLDGATFSTIVTTDANGRYTFTGLSNGSYTITPNKPDVTFNPTSSVQTMSGAGISAINFAATPTKAGPFIISGSVSSNGLFGITLTLSGASSATVTTDPYGTFEFTGLANGSYTVTPSRTGFTFSPTSSTQTVSGTDVTGVTFTATPVQSGIYTIFGHVSAVSAGDSTGVIGVTMTLSGTNSATTTTDIYGTYSFTGLANGSYTITPSRTGFFFSPTSSTQTVSGANIGNVAFDATSTQSGPIVTCPASGTTNVTIQNFSFTPQNVTISAGGIVKWTDNGTTHTVTSGTSPTPDGKFNSGNLGTGSTVCVQFPTTGTYNYFCNIHPYNMIGSVVVQ
jgi:plastocyanin